MKIKFNLEPSKKTDEPKVLSSKSELSAKRFKDWMAKNSQVYGIETEDQIKEILVTKRLMLPGVSTDEVITELKKAGFIFTPLSEKIIKIKEPEFVKTDYKKISITQVEDANLKKQLEENKFFEELEKNVFKNDKELDDIYNTALSLSKIKENNETEEYYNQFADAGLIKGGREEARQDLQSLEERKIDFKRNEESLDISKIARKENAKKIATVVERVVAYSVSDLGWYGENVSIKPTSDFDDIKRGVDDVLEIEKDGDDSSFMALAIDVTYRGLLSEQYKNKLFGLLKKIQDNQKTRIKYFKNHKGEMMREFSAPKIILFFNMDDVKDMLHLIKNIDNRDAIEEFKNSPQKFAVLNQMIIQCETLSGFAEECQNDIFRKYTEIVSSFKELAWKNPDIKQILDTRHEDEVSKHMKYLIEEFKKGNN